MAFAMFIREENLIVVEKKSFSDSRHYNSTMICPLDLSFSILNCTKGKLTLKQSLDSREQMQTSQETHT